MSKDIMKNHQRQTTSTSVYLDNRTEVFTEASPRIKYKEHWIRAKKKLRLYRLAGIDPFSTKKEALLSSLSANLVLFPYSPIYLAWVLFIAFLLLYLTIYGIFHTSFIGDSVSSKELKFESFIDIMFIIDIIVLFNLAVYDENNNLSCNRKTIAKKYIKGRFILDLLAAIPSGIYVSLYPEYCQNNLIIFRHVLKIGKWIGFEKKIRSLSLIKSIDHFFILNRNFCEFLIFLCTVGIGIHIGACLFYLALRTEEHNENNLLLQPRIPGLDHSQLLNSDIPNIYLSCLYFIITTVTTVGYGDIHAFTPKEKLFSIFLMCFVIFFLSVTSSKSLVLLNQIFKKDGSKSYLLDYSDKFCKKIRINSNLKKRIKRSIRNSKIFKIYNISNLFSSLDPSLAYEVAISIFNGALTNVPFIYLKSKKFIGDIAFRLVYTHYETDEYIWRKNSFSDGVYFIVQGAVNYYYENALFYVYRDKGYFGDIEMVLKTQRLFCAKTFGIFKCFKMGNECFKYVKEAYPKEFKVLKKSSKIRSNQLMKGLAQMIAIYEYRNGNIDFISDAAVNRIQLRCFIDNFSGIFNANKGKIIRDAILDLDIFQFYWDRVVDLCSEIGIREDDEDIEITEI